MSEYPKPRGIIFDWDNTLVDTWPTIHAALANTFNDMGLTPWTMQEVMQRVQHSMRDSFPKIFGDNWEKASGLYQSYYLATHLEKLRALPGAKEVLDFIAGKDVFVAIVSNKKGPNLRKEVEHLGWGHYFDKVVGAHDAANDKPHADPVHMAFEGSGFTAGKDIWFIGDSAIDLECAKNAGMNALFFGTNAEAAHLLERSYMGFDFSHHVKDHEELLGLLQETF